MIVVEDVNLNDDENLDENYRGEIWRSITEMHKEHTVNLKY